MIAKWEKASLQKIIIIKVIIKSSSPVKNILLTVSYFLLGSFLYCGAFILHLLSQSPKLGDELFFNVFHFCGGSYDRTRKRLNSTLM